MQKTIKTGLIVSLLVSVVSAEPTVIKPENIIEFSISRSGLTRISVENDGVEDVFAYPAVPDNIQRHASGHVFVVGDGLDKPLSLTIITKRGVAQDLRLTPTNKKPSPIILKFEEEKAQQPDNTEEQFAFLKVFLNDDVPAGFQSTGLAEASRSKGHISAIGEVSFTNGFYTVTKFIVKNEGDKRLLLEPRSFFEGGDLAVVFKDEALDSGSSTILFILRKRSSI